MMLDIMKTWNILRYMLGEEGSMRRQTLTGGYWMLCRSLLTALTDLARAAVFARVLFPVDYGLMALATMVIGFLESFSPRESSS